NKGSGNMRHGDRLTLLVLLSGAGWCAGCSQNGPFLSSRTTVGTLQSSVSHLEFENGQLRRQVAQLKSENRQIEDHLVQEESRNGELTARINDLEGQTASGGSGWDDRSREERDAARALPAGQSSRKRRKPPVARIPGLIDDLPTQRSRATDETEI